MSSQFDVLARMYEESFQLPWRSHLEAHSIFELIGDLDGKRVLDIGCGTGVYCRAIADRGAAQVVGYDTSDGMIEHARTVEQARQQGIRYTTDPPAQEAGTFDLVLAVYVLPYAEDNRALGELCAVAAQALRPGGRLITLPLHPEFNDEPRYYERYHLDLNMPQPRTDGSPVEMSVRFGPYDTKITARYWSRSTLERALRGAGFVGITWHPHQVSQQGLAEHGAEYFALYLSRPHAGLVDARRP